MGVGYWLFLSQALLMYYIRILQGLVHQFQVDSATRVAVLSMKAAGVVWLFPNIDLY